MTEKSKVALVDAFAQKNALLEKEIAKVIVGQEEVVRHILHAIFCNGHSLLVGVPGLAKTLLVHTISRVLDLSFNRIQFTPDLMPSDILGAELLNDKKEFIFKKGPIFSHIILADEINRTPPKTQSALLEAMQEKTVTVSGQKYVLPRPFFVLATQNPVEQEGTYPLPEAQLDRFMYHIVLDYPSYEQECQIVKNTTSTRQVDVNMVFGQAELVQFQQLIRQIPIADNVLEYAVKLVNKTRPQFAEAPTIIKEYIAWGAGPRASQYLVLGAKCYAASRGKYSPDISDVQAIAIPILRHRMFKNYKAEAENLSLEEIIKQIY